MFTAVRVVLPQCAHGITSCVGGFASVCTRYHLVYLWLFVNVRLVPPEHVGSIEIVTIAFS